MADSKVSNLTPATALAEGDILYLVTAALADRKITIANLFQQQLCRVAMYDSVVAGEWTTTGTTHSVVDVATDLTVAAKAGDVIRVGASGSWNAVDGSGVLDARTKDGGNYIGDPENGATGFGVRAWYGAFDEFRPFGGTHLYTVVGGDVVAGEIDLELVFRHTSSTKKLDKEQFHWYVENLGTPLS